MKTIRDADAKHDIAEIVVPATLAHHPEVQAGYLFGSYGTEDERPGSDADIGLLLSPGESKRAGSLLASTLHL
jgi:hypothetical protein